MNLTVWMVCQKFSAKFLEKLKDFPFHTDFGESEQMENQK